jgi:hypothetical protein
MPFSSGLANSNFYWMKWLPCWSTLCTHSITTICFRCYEMLISSKVMTKTSSAWNQCLQNFASTKSYKKFFTQRLRLNTKTYLNSTTWPVIYFIRIKKSPFSQWRRNNKANMTYNIIQFKTLGLTVLVVFKKNESLDLHIFLSASLRLPPRVTCPNNNNTKFPSSWRAMEATIVSSCKKTSCFQ